MYLAKRILMGLMVSGWVLTIVVGSASAQVDLEAAISGTPPSQSGWHQRVVGGAALRNEIVRSSRRQQAVTRGTVTRDRIDPWADARVVSTAAEEPVVQEVIETPPPMTAPGYDTRLDPMPMEGETEYVDGCEMCPGPCECPPRFGRCGPCPPGYGWEGWWLRNFTFFGGVQGFKGPIDNGHNGNFGFHEGFNFGRQIGRPWLGIGNPWGIGIQAGLEVVHSNFNGTSAAAPLGPGDNRNQFFFTGGLFRRALEGGLQWGVAVDAMRDEYFGSADLCQIRVEASWVRSCRGEIGFWGAYGTKSDEMTTVDQGATVELKPISQNVFFLRRYFSNGGEGRLWAGFTGDSDGLVGGDLRVPLGDHWAIENRFNFLIPEEGTGADGMREESWAVRLQLVWYPHRNARCARANRFRPLFDVADNAVFMVGRQ